MQLVVSYRSDLADLNLAGMSAKTRMQEAFCGKAMQIKIQERNVHDPAGVDPPFESGPLLWVEGVLPLLNSKILEDMWMELEKKEMIAAYSAGRPNCGIIGVQDITRLKPENPFEELIRQNKPEKFSYDPFHLYPLENPKDFYALSQHFFQEKREELLGLGVYLMDPASTLVETRVHVEAGAWIDPQVQITGMTTILSGARIAQGSIIHNSSIGNRVQVKPYSLVYDSTIDDDAQVGPFAHIRPETHIGKNSRVGNFVETKKAKIGAGSKASHLTYLGDTVIGRDCNIGAGTITCNYDGVNKHKTVMGDRVFIGSDSQLVAPVQLGDDSYVAAGSTITHNIPSNALGISRGRQVTKEGLASKLRERAQKQSQAKSDE